MKISIYKSLLIALSASFFTGCSESFLDSDPITDITEQSYYLTLQDLEKALTGCYSGYQMAWDGGVAMPVSAEIMSDNCLGGTGKTDDNKYYMINSFDKNDYPGLVDLYNDNWKAYYAAIGRCNKLLTKIGNLNLKESDKINIEGQTRFLRATLYFDMVRMWENIVLKLNDDSNDEPQAKPRDVYAAIADDYKFAAENLTYDGWSAEWASKNDGRATQWAAKGMLARVFLFYTGYYGQTALPSSQGEISKAYVLEGLEHIIANGQFSLVPEFKNLWLSASNTIDKGAGEAGADILGLGTYAGEGNCETLFSIKYNYTASWDGNYGSNKWLVMLGVRGAKSGFPYGQGWGAATVNQNLYKSYLPADSRRTASIIDVASELPGTGTFDLTSHVNDMRDYTGYMNKKYTPLSNPDGSSYAQYLAPDKNTSFMICQFQDFIVLRYSDILLMASELGSDKKQDYFDMVRSRANLFTQTCTQENILAERRLEFAFEGIRYWDLLRQGIDVAATTIYNNENGIITKFGGVETTHSIDVNKIKNSRGFQQIPATQISLSGNMLNQNPGWE